MPPQIWRPARDTDGGAVTPRTRWARRAAGTLVAVGLVAGAAGVWVTPTSIRSWHEHSYCRSDRKAIVANHERLMADGQGPDPYYEEHFVAHHDWMDRCLAVQRCQRRGLLGLNHGPRKGCSINSADGVANGAS